MKNLFLLLFVCSNQFAYGINLLDFPQTPPIFLERRIDFQNSQHVLQLLRVVEIYPTLLQSLDIQIQKKSILEEQLQQCKLLSKTQNAQLKRAQFIKKILLGSCFFLSAVASISLGAHLIR